MKGTVLFSFIVASSTAFPYNPTTGLGDIAPIRRHAIHRSPSAMHDPSTLVGRKLQFQASEAPWKKKEKSLVLCLLPISVTNVAASAALAGSSLAGCLIERWFSNSGILSSMALAAFASNWSLVPSIHPLYDLCWSLFLPASLAFLLLSFLTCRTFPQMGMSPAEAALAAPCLCASFVGGTVNFFATAKVIERGRMSTLMGTMAAADTFVMALYFAVMTLALKSKFLARMFDGGTSNSEIQPRSSKAEEDQAKELFPPFVSKKETAIPVATTVSTTTLVTALALVIVKVASTVEGFLSPILPGAACAVIAIVTPAVQRLLSKQRSSFTKQMERAAAKLSKFALLLFFAAVGVSCNLRSALLHGPACVCFSLLALSVHIFVAFAGSLVAKKIFPLQRITLQDVLVASNAAVGGPATAAAFAGRMNVPRQRGLTVAGTVWGVVGYAIGTTIGVSLHSILRRYS